MNNKQVIEFFKNKEIEEANCPLTDELIKGGYKQKSKGYIDYAKEKGVKNPTQYWHLIESWSNRSGENEEFNKNIQCGELIFWMAEVSKVVEYQDLKDLKDEILEKYIENRRDGNKKIQEVCFDKIVKKVESNNLKQSIKNQK